ncbi:MAG: MgtC/SapB family protein [Candidatus Pacearchaeota archaeon]
MDYITLILRLLIVTLLSGLIGWEREAYRVLVKGTAGLRTHMLVGLAAALLTIISLHFFEIYGSTADPGRIVSYIILGIGFISAGTIMASKKGVIGLTTAASIWLVSAVGISVALGLYLPAVVTTVIALIILEFWRFEKKSTD